MPETTKTIEIWADTRGPGTCKGRSCHARLEWAELVASGKRMCFDAPIVAMQTRHDPATRRLIEVVDVATNHWATCPDRKQFTRKDNDR